MTNGLPSTSELFVNRDDLITAFERALSSIEPMHSRQVLVFHGAGGQGKTRLREHFEKMLPKKPTEVGPNQRWGIVDLHSCTERQQEYILIWIRNALKRRSKVSFPAFDMVFAVFWMERHGNAPPFLENPWWEEISSAADKVIAEETTKLLKDVPFVGSVVGRLGRVLLDFGREMVLIRRSEEALGDLRSGGRWLPAEKIISKLPIILAHDINHWCSVHSGDRFILMVDEYESVLEAGGAGSRFKRSEIDEAVRCLVTHCNATLFVFFSREKLQWGAIHRSWDAVLNGRQHPVAGLSKGHAEQLLTLAKVDDTAIRAAMINGASALDPTSDIITCYPIMLEMQIEFYRSLSADDVPVTADHFRIDGQDFEPKRNELLSRLLRSYPEQLEETLRRLAVARRFDRSIFEFVIRKFLTGLPADAWPRVQALSIVQRSAIEGVHVFHQVIREGLLATLEPEALNDTHEVFSEYFKLAVTPSPGVKVGAAQAAAAGEAFYHMKSVDPKAACSWWLDVDRAFRGSAMGRLVEDIHRANVALAAQTHTETSNEYARCLAQLGKNLDAQGRYEEAEDLYRRTLEILDDTKPDTALTAAKILYALGIVLDYQKKHAEAGTVLRKSLKIRQNMLKPRDKEIGMSLTALGMNFSHQRLYTKAEELIREALAIVGEDDPSAATIFLNLGVCLGDQERLREAEETHRKGLALCERKLGHEHYRTGQSLGYLALILDRRGKPENAEALIRRAITIAAMNNGLDHRETAGDFYWLGRILHNQRRFEEAVEPHSRALAIRERVLGPSHLDTAASLAGLGWTLYRCRNKEAVDYLRRALDIRESVLGHDHPVTRISARQLARAEGTSLLKVETIIRGLDELGDGSPSEFSHVMSILDPGAPDPVWPEGWGSLGKLVLRFHDATVASPTATMFATEHLEALLCFADQMAAADAGALVLHSTLGMSRSTACAVILQAHLESHLSGVALFSEILKIRDIAWPNLHIVELGDARLGRGGDLIAGAHAVYRYQLQRHPDWAERLTRAGRGREVAAAATGAVISL
jgi:tetratricopeptide (TPR) repeat protein/predicted protein tyrosine phosphatase